MNYKAQYSETDIQFLEALFEGGHQDVFNFLEELMGLKPQQFSVSVSAIPASQLIRAMDVGIEPLGTVFSRFGGGVQGQFLFLQSKTDLELFNESLGAQPEPVPDVKKDDDSHMVPEWLKEQRETRRQNQGSKKDVLATISDLGNSLFAIYGSTLLHKTKLGIFQDISDATMDEHQMALSNAVSHCIKSSNLGILFTVSFLAGSNSLKFWLLMLPNPEGYSALLDCMENQGTTD